MKQLVRVLFRSWCITPEFQKVVSGSKWQAEQNRSRHSDHPFAHDDKLDEAEGNSSPTLNSRADSLSQREKILIFWIFKLVVNRLSVFMERSVFLTCVFHLETRQPWAKISSIYFV